jgi:hypothetical protein
MAAMEKTPELTVRLALAVDSAGRPAEPVEVMP